MPAPAAPGAASFISHRPASIVSSGSQHSWRFEELKLWVAWMAVALFGLLAAVCGALVLWFGQVAIVALTIAAGMAGFIFVFARELPERVRVERMVVASRPQLVPLGASQARQRGGASMLLGGAAV